MKLGGVITLSVLLAVSIAVSDAVDEPMVAFLCNRPAMHATDRGWIRDDSTNCLKDPVDILNYCRKVYPRLDVWNVVESSETVSIANWCNFGHSRCRHRFTVRPYRCLVGAFQSEALQVPEHCQFDHIHDASECKSYVAWNQSATSACASRHGSWLHGFSVLQPCGIDGFNGAEFVCCPAESRTTEHENVRQSTAEATTAAATSTVAVPTTTTMPVITLRDAEELSPMKMSEKTDGSVHLTEHDRFLHAKANLERHHHEKVAKMMKDWAAARHRVMEIKKIDAKGGEKFNREMTARFQKAYESLEHEAALERKQLMSEHQQRIQQELSKKKTQAMESYLAALADEDPDATHVLTTLMQYVKAEQKDRVHSINHYEHIEESDPVEAETQRSAVAAHLRGIDERVTQAIDMLSRVPKYEKKIRAQIERFLSSYQSLDESLAVIMAKINEKSNHLPAKLSNLFTSQSTTDTVNNLTTVLPEDESTFFTATSPSPSSTASSTESDVDSLTTKRSPVTADTSVLTTQSTRKPTERHFVEVKQIIEHAAHNEKNDLVVLESYIKKLPVHIDNNGHLVAPLAIAVCGIAVFVIVVVGIVLMRRRTTGVLSERSVTEIDRSASSTQPTVAAEKAPPVNGYENPTYQYYVAEAAAKGAEA